jgi:UDP-glucose 4-epimerase
MISKKKILVTGGAGFVGTNLIESLVNEYKEYEITSLDCYFTSTEDNHIINDRVNYVNGYTWEINEIFSENDFDIIFHFGEYSRIVHSFKDIDFVSKSILNGTSAVLNFALKNNSKFIYSASSSKFGNDGTDENLSPYAFLKSKMVDLIKNYGSWFNLDYEIAYFFNVYGKRQIYTGKYATVIAIFEKQYLDGEKLTVVSPGTQSRDFTHVKDIVSGLLSIMKINKNGEWHLRSGKIFTILEVVKMFDVNYNIIPERRGERFTAEQIDSNTQEVLDWEPNKSLQEWINQIKK